MCSKEKPEQACAIKWMQEGYSLAPSTGHQGMIALIFTHVPRITPLQIQVIEEEDNLCAST